MASGLWLCAGLGAALSVVEAGALLVAASVLWLCAGLEVALSVEISVALRVALAFWPADGRVVDLLIVLSAVLLVWLGCSFVKRASPSLLCSGRE